MRLEHYSEKKLKKEILEIVGKRLDLKKYKVFFFGSRVKGDNFERSDIDIGIEGSEEISSGIKLDIEEEIEKIPTLYKIDFVDFKEVGKNFAKIAKEKIEILNP